MEIYVHDAEEITTRVKDFPKNSAPFTVLYLTTEDGNKIKLFFKSLDEIATFGSDIHDEVVLKEREIRERGP